MYNTCTIHTSLSCRQYMYDTCIEKIMIHVAYIYMYDTCIIQNFDVSFSFEYVYQVDTLLAVCAQLRSVMLHVSYMYRL